MDLESVADELYALPLGEFTATRNAREKQAKKDGDKGLAAAIHALEKPTVAAWLTNRLVREHPDEIGPLLELGAALRQATATLSGPELRDLTRQEHKVVRALVQQAKAIGSGSGQRVTEDVARGVETTLRAALADEELAGQLAAGRLTTTLEHVGFGIPGAFGTPGERATASRAPAARRTERQGTGGRRTEQQRADQRRTEQRDKAAREVEEAERDVRDAEAAGAEQRSRLEAAQANARDIGTTVERLQGELTRALAEQRAAERDERKAHAAADRAERAVREARHRLEQARHRLEQARERLDAAD